MPTQKEKPIIFSGEMIRAILGRKKTQTRRVIKPQPDRIWEDGHPYWNIGGLRIPKCPYGQPEDRLWVRETYGKSLCGSNIYKADFNPDHPFMPKWKPSIFMSRIASRITLEIISVRVERLQEISQMDIQAEGTPGLHPLGGAYPNQWRERFQSLWNSINKKHPWASNPWVWSIEFKRL